MNHRKVSSQLFSSAFNLCASNTVSAENDFASRKRMRDGECNIIKKKHAFHQAHHLGKTSGDSLMLIEKYSPQTKDDLAVHKKKVSEVEQWLKDSLKKSDRNQGACILLLTGPPGVGKTATVYALSKDLNVEVKEWTNSIQTNWNSNEYSSAGGPSGFAYESQASVFRSFLLRANKYPPLFSLCTGRMVLIEEFPNTFLKRETAVFHEILRKFHRIGRCPLVFIVSDCTTGESAEQSLFPKDLQNELCIRNISFNPVAPTMLLKVLNKINMDFKGMSHKRLSKTELETIASECMGDIRNAVNTLQFLSAPSVEKMQCAGKAPSLAEKKQSSEFVSDNTGSGGNRDTSLFLFHALGKILYCKRDNTKKAEDYPLPPHLSHLSRAPLLENPEEVYNKTSVSEETFILFLQQNYLSFIEDIKDAAECSSWLSHSETLTSEWSERQTMNFYATSLATRGLMFNLTPHSSRNRWRPLHKPQYFGSTKDNRYLCQSVKYAFKDKQLSLRELEVEFIPYMAKITRSFQNNDMKQLVKQLGTLQSQGVHRSQCDSLCEKELYEINRNDLEYYHEVERDHDRTNDNENMLKPCMQDMHDEEFIIEECDI